MSAANVSAAVPGARRLLFTVRLAAEFINGSLEKMLAKAPDESSPWGISGILFGNLDSAELEVRAGRPPGTGELLESLLAPSSNDSELSSLTPVGWYALRQAGGLLERDIEFHNQHFSRPTDLAIVIRPEREREVVFELYSRSADGVLSPDAHRWGLLRFAHASRLSNAVEVPMRSQIQDDFYMRTYQLQESALENLTVPKWKQALRQLRLPRKSQAPKPELEFFAPSRVAAAPLARTIDASQLSKPSYAEPLTFARPPRLWLALAIAFAVAAIVTFLIVRLSLQPARTYAPVTTSAPLGLKLQGQGERLLISWDRNSLVAQLAREGSLSIDDGSSHRTVSLDASQVANGSVLYTPNSGDVTFRLEVVGKDGRKVSETTRVLDASRPPALAKSSRSTAPNAGGPAWKVTAQRVSAAAPAETTALTPTRSQQFEPPAVVEQAPAESSSPTLPIVLEPAPTPPPQETAQPDSQQRVPVTQESAPSPVPIVVPPADPVQARVSSYRPPRPRRQVMPNVRQLAPGMAATAGQVEVTVRIDRGGRVMDARISNANRKLNSALAAAATSAAREWLFDPAIMGGQPIESEHLIVFNFKP